MTAARAMFTPIDFSPYPWMMFALAEVGTAEVPGNRSNPRICEYLAAAGLGADPDETPWCSAFVNWCMGQAKIQGTGRANARSWLNWSDKCLAAPHYGAVAVLRAETSAQRVLVEYVQGKSGFMFTHLRVAFWSTGAELKAAYDAIDAQLNKTLGKPQWTRKVRDALPSRAYRVDKKLTIVLGEGLEKGKSLVRLELGGLQGERD